MDYYEVLNVSRNATTEEIKQKYRELCYTYHADKCRDTEKKDEYELRMKEVNEAYETLGDSTKKAAYDMPSMEQIFGNMFKKQDPIDELFGANMFAGFMPASPLNIKVEIGFIDSYTGVSLPVNVKREIRTGKSISFEIERMYIDIKEGIDDEEIIIISNKGNIGDGRSSDLRLHIHVIPTESFSRDGLNLLHTQNITFKESIVGFNYSIEHLDGRVLKLQSSKGNIIQNMERKFIKGNGFKRDGRKGDLIIQFKVAPFVGKLTDEQIDAFQNLF